MSYTRWHTTWINLPSQTTAANAGFLQHIEDTFVAQDARLTTLEASGTGGGSGAVSSVNSHTGVVVLNKTDVGLANADNTSDVNKPISTAVSTALAAKADLVLSRVPTAQLGSGAASTTTFLRGDQTWVVPPTGTGGGSGVTSVGAGDTSIVIGGTTTAPTVAVNATGTANSTTFLRGDRQWAVPTMPISPFITLTDAATINTDCSLGSKFKVTLGGNRTLAAPSGMVDGQRVTWELIQDATGSRNLTFDSIFVAGNSSIDGSLTNRPAGTSDIMEAIYDANKVKFFIMSLTSVGRRAILNAGSALANRPTLDITGTGILTTDDSVNNKTIIKVPGQNGIATPESQNLIAWAFDPGPNNSQSQPVAGTIYLIKLLTPPRGQASIGTVYWYVSTTFSGVTAGQNLVGMYSSAGAQLDTPVSIDTDITTTGLKSSVFSGAASTTSAQSFIWVAFLFNATTLGNILRGTGSAGFANVGLTASTYRYAINGTGATSLPSTITPASNTSGSQAFWAAIGV